jgi:hypothetical protein
MFRREQPWTPAPPEDLESGHVQETPEHGGAEVGGITVLPDPVIWMAGRV